MKVIIVVDEYPQVAEVIAGYLVAHFRGKGVDLVAVHYEDGSVAKNHIMAASVSCQGPDLLITDIDLGGPISGIDLARYVEILEEGYCPVILMTGSGKLEEDFPAVVRRPILRKPIDLDVLAARVSELLGI